MCLETVQTEADVLYKQGVEVMDYICGVYKTATPCFHTQLINSLHQTFFFVEPATNLKSDIVAHRNEGVEGGSGSGGRDG